MSAFDPLRTLGERARLTVMSSFNVPARRLHWAAFAGGTLFALLGLAIIWIARDQSKSWAFAWYYAANGFIPSIVMVVTGALLRRRYLRRLKEREALLKSLNRD